MKAKIVGENKEIELPKLFSSKIREDICQKVYEIEKRWQPYAPYFLAGKLYSASGKIRHQRHRWKTSYGRGISRVPRKILWRRGTQFYWIGATVAGTRGGRRAHPPKIEHFLKKLKINKKEKLIAYKSAIAATASFDYIKKRYATLEEEKIKIGLPLIIKSDLLKLKIKNFLKNLKENFSNLYEFLLKSKKRVGMLLVIGNSEEFKTKMFDVRKVSEIRLADLYPLGRLTIYTEQAIKDLEEFEKKNKKEKSKEGK